MELHDLLPSLKAMLAAIPCPHPWGEHYRRVRVMALSLLDPGAGVRGVAAWMQSKSK